MRGHNNLWSIRSIQLFCFNVTSQCVTRTGPHPNQLVNFIIERSCIDTLVGDFQRVLSCPRVRHSNTYSGILALTQIPIELSEVTANRRLEAIIPYERLIAGTKQFTPKIVCQVNLIRRDKRIEQLTAIRKIADPPPIDPDGDLHRRFELSLQNQELRQRKL